MPEHTAPAFITTVVAALDNAWAPLRERMTGLTDAEAWWEPAPACWTVRERDGGWFADWSEPDPEPAPVTTIAWRAWHIAIDCLDSYSRRAFGRTGTTLTGEAWVGTWDESSSLLDRAWAVFRDGVAAWSDDTLAAPLGELWGTHAKNTHGDLALHAAREVIHHGAEIALLRDLYRSRQ